MHMWRDIPSAGRPRPPRHCQEVQINTFLLLSALRRHKIRRFLAWCVIYDPQGIYYGGTIAAPVIGDIFENIFPYLGIEKE